MILLLAACATPVTTKARPVPADEGRCEGPTMAALDREGFVGAATDAAGTRSVTAGHDCLGGHGRKWALGSPATVQGVPCADAVVLDDDRVPGASRWRVETYGRR